MTVKSNDTTWIIEYNVQIHTYEKPDKSTAQLHKGRDRDGQREYREIVSRSREREREGYR